MIPYAHLASIKTIVIHDECVDGYLSGLLLRHSLPDATLISWKHDAELAIPDDRHPVLFCDISPPVDRVAEFADKGTIVLDHHETARSVFDVRSSSGASLLGLSSNIPGVSGAVLALEQVYRPLRVLREARNRGQGQTIDPTVREIARLIGLYDTWQEGNDSFEDACAAHAALELLMTAEGFKISLFEIATKWERLYEPMGDLLVMQEKNAAARACASAIHETFRGPRGEDVRVAVITERLEKKSTLNLAATMLCENADLVISARHEPPASLAEDTYRISVSLRSRAGFPCNEIAKRYGGGGHRGAAGFRIPSRDEDPAPVQAAHAIRSLMQPGHWA